jgi:4-diphosphocytidyl-2-C-methyl-D-erythritol kinase
VTAAESPSGATEWGATPFRVRAQAKVNLSLRIAGARQDGFHDVRTVLQSIALHDTLTIAPAPGAFSLDCAARGVPAGPRNLVWRAAVELWRALDRPGEPHGASITLDKKIPAQAGLGGGSADAAAALMALSRAWNAPFDTAALAEIAARLGSDVAFFLHGGTALGLERGDVITPLADAPPRSLVIVLPGFGVPTERAYGWYDADRRERGDAAVDERPDLGEGTVFVNDFEAVVARRYPEIGLMKNALGEAGATASLLCGSGAAVFGVFASDSDAARAGEVLARRGWQTLVTRTVGRAEYRARLFDR